MSDDWQIEKGKKIRVSTYTSDFEGIIEQYHMGSETDYVCLKNAEEVYDHLYHGSDSYSSGNPAIEYGLAEHRRKAGKIKIPLDKINHYEFLDDEEESTSKYCTECGSKL